MEDATIESGYGVVNKDGELIEIKGPLPEEGEGLMRMLFENEENAILLKKGETIDSSKIYKL